MRVIYKNPVSYNEYRDERRKIHNNINSELNDKKNGLNKVTYVVIPLYFICVFLILKILPIILFFILKILSKIFYVVKVPFSVIYLYLKKSFSRLEEIEKKLKK
jgi:preprotein translocase subunit SecG